MTVEDVFTQNRRLWVRLREKSGKRHAMPCHHNLEEYLAGYLDGAGLRGDPKGPLFRTIGAALGKAHPHRAAAGERLCDDPPRRAAAGIATKLGNHSFRATGIPPISRMAAPLKSCRDGEPCSTRTTLTLRSAAGTGQPR